MSLNILAVPSDPFRVACVFSSSLHCCPSFWPAKPPASRLNIIMGNFAVRSEETAKEVWAFNSDAVALETPFFAGSRSSILCSKVVFGQGLQLVAEEGAHGSSVKS